MKNSFYLILIFLLSHLVSVPAQAIVSKEYVRWAKGKFEVPADIKKLTKSSELQVFLRSKKSFTRMAAVRRLGEIEGPNSIDLLVKKFNEEPTIKGAHAFPLVKLEVVRTLDRINTEQAKSALLMILSDLLRKGPKVEAKKNFRVDKDFSMVVPLILEKLYRWGQDKEVFQAVEKIAFSEDVKNFYRYPNGIGQRAWEIYLKSTIIQKGIVDEKDSAIYLLNFIEDIRKAGIDSVTLGALKSAAAQAVLERRSEAVLSSLVNEFKEQFKKEPRGPKGSLTERHNILRDKIDILTKILRIKKEKEEKKEV